MQCPYCANQTKVTNSRSRANNTQVWRRRECMRCGSVWTTHEAIDPSTSHRVQSAHNTVEPFSRDVLFMSIIDSLKHRKTALKDATALTDTVLARILAQKTALITTQTIKDTTHTTLKRFDSTAAAVYSALHA